MRPFLVLGSWMTIALMVLISSGAQGVAPENRTRLFKFQVRFQRPLQPAGVRIMERGTLLKPIDPQNRENYYQSVVMCKSVKIEFDDLGKSNFFTVEGFCFDPGVKPPPQGVEWRVAGLVSSKIRERCHLIDQLDVREPKVLGGWHLMRPPCEGKRDPCAKAFDVFLRTEHGKSFQEFYQKGICRMQKELRPPSAVWELWCDERVAFSRTL